MKTQRTALILLLLGQLAPCLYGDVNQWTGATALDVRLIRFHPHRTSLMYLAADQGLFSTEDEGKTVAALNNGLPYEKVTAFELDPSDPSTLYAIVGRRLFRSSNAGREWRPIATWDLSDQETKLAIDSKHGRLLYLVTPDGSIKRSTDRGTTWGNAGHRARLMSRRQSIRSRNPLQR